ncbi:unnamed protein product [Urochloa decumbens]|uniref:BURP domain-containing protein n=1 Tax=Urochloa decumbens TaxID=240449 RepID=A0ABC9B402_9POAL
MATRSLAAAHLLLLLSVGTASGYQYEEDSVGRTFFLQHDLYPGSKMTLHFTLAAPGAPSLPRAMPRARADSIPFSSTKIPEILSLFSIPTGSPAAAAVRHTLAECEAPPVPGVKAQRCATSSESMVDFAASNLGTRAIHAGMTRVISKKEGKEGATPRQAYLLQSVMPLPVVGRDMVACHAMPYPYAVFGCHTTTAAVFAVALAGADGTRVEALAACHKDATPGIPWPTYQKLGITPGTVAVCHFLPQDGKLWMRK